MQNVVVGFPSLLAVALKHQDGSYRCFSASCGAPHLVFVDGDVSHVACPTCNRRYQVPLDAAIVHLRSEVRALAARMATAAAPPDIGGLGAVLIAAASQAAAAAPHIDAGGELAPPSAELRAAEAAMRDTLFLLRQLDGWAGPEEETRRLVACGAVEVRNGLAYMVRSHDLRKNQVRKARTGLHDGVPQYVLVTEDREHDARVQPVDVWGRPIPRTGPSGLMPADDIIATWPIIVPNAHGTEEVRVYDTSDPQTVTTAPGGTPVGVLAPADPAGVVAPTTLNDIDVRTLQLIATAGHSGMRVFYDDLPAPENVRASVARLHAGGMIESLGEGRYRVTQAELQAVLDAFSRSGRRS